MLKITAENVQEIECCYRHVWMDEFFEELINSDRSYIKITVANALFTEILKRVIKELDKKNVTIDLHTVDSLLVSLEDCNLNHCRITRPVIPELKLSNIKCNIRSLDLKDYYSYLTPYEEVQPMEKPYSGFVKDLKLWGLSSLPNPVKSGFPNLEKLEFTLYDEMKDNYVVYIRNIISWIEGSDIPEIKIYSVNINVMTLKLNPDIFCDVFFELQTSLWNPDDEFLDLEDVKKFMLIGEEASNGVFQFLSNITSVAFERDRMDVVIQLYSKIFKSRFVPTFDLSFIRKVLVLSAFYTKEVVLKTFESWMTPFFCSLSHNDRIKPIKITVDSGSSFDLCIVEAIKEMNERDTEVRIVIREPGFLENLNGCRLDYLKLEMLFLPMVETLMNCTCHIKKLDLGHYNIEAGSGPSITIQNDLLKSVEELILPDVQPFFPLDSFTSVRATFPNAEKISIEVFVGWIFDPNIIINHLIDIYKAIQEAPQNEISVSVRYLNAQQYMYRKIIEILETKQEFEKLEDKFFWIDPGNPLKKLKFGFDVTDFSEKF